MKITKQELIEMNACSKGLKRFINQTNNTTEPVDVSSLVGGLNTYSDLLWLAGETLPKERIVRFACDCALINIEKIKPYTDKYDEIVAFLLNPDAACATTTVEAAAARAATAAVDAVDAVYAADAIYAAATTTVEAAAARAATAADDADDAVYAAAARAATAADDAVDAAVTQVNSLLIEMFEEIDK